MESITIRIWPTEQGGDEESEEETGGYMYEIYDTESPDEDAESIDGGLCTTTLENALDMATSQAKDIINRKATN